MTAEDRLRSLGYELGDSPEPVGQYVRCVVAGHLAFTAGHGPFDQTGQVAMRGQVGGEGDLSVEKGREAARLAAVACLASLKAELGSLDRIQRIVKILGFVNCGAGFSATSAVMDGASELLNEVFEERGVHARAAIGTTVLPYDIPVEIEMVVEIE